MSFNSKKLLLGSQNPSKIKELSELLAPYGVEVLSLEGWDLPDPEETEDTFEGNALLKARYYAKETGHAVLADDSGVTIDALNGEPGVHSKRFVEKMGGPEKTFDYLEEKLVNQNKRASMRCVLALVDDQGHEQTFEGICDGELVFPARGKGFCFDPVFQPLGYQETFGENHDLKKNISHRAKALELLLAHCFGK